MNVVFSGKVAIMTIYFFILVVFVDRNTVKAKAFDCAKHWLKCVGLLVKTTRI